MKRLARACFVLVPLVVVSVAGVSHAEPPAAASASLPERPVGQGVVVLALGNNAHEEAFALARAIYASRLRPTALDEVRARVLAGGAPPANALRELRDLAEIRAGLTGDDAAARRLLTGIGQQLGAEALLVVKVEGPAEAPVVAPSTIGSPADAADGGADAAPENAAPGNAAPAPTVVARLFLVGTGEFDAARYSPDPGPQGPRAPAAWKSTVTSLEGRFPAGSRTAGPVAATKPAPPVRQEGGKSSPFYTSGWFWGAVGGAALLGAAFLLATRDTTSETIHLQMRVPQ
jgi:hypothetical protein